jgi:5-methyltetrahydrofolate--homocysteine methyltransferase
LSFLSLLDAKRLIVGDGAMGSRLMEMGLPPDHCAGLWNLERPEDVLRVHREYVEAGSDLLLTNTFGAGPVLLARDGLESKCEQIHVAGVELARRAAGGRAAVVGDIGATGRLLEPLGDLSEREALSAYRRQAAALAGADALIFETFESSAELKVALRGARDCCDLPLVACMTFHPEAAGRYRSIMGEGPQELVRVAAECGCAVVGTNCGQGIATMPLLVKQIAGLADGRMPVIVEPNAGLPRLVEGRTVYQEDPSLFRRHVPELYAAGARIIGGCDGTTAEHVRVIRGFADSLG